jgi:hypothetical protein
MQVDGRRGRKGGEIGGTLALVRPRSFGHGADDLPIDNPPHPGTMTIGREVRDAAIAPKATMLTLAAIFLATPPPRSRPCRRDHPEGQVRGHLRPAPLLDQPAAKLRDTPVPKALGLSPAPGYCLPSRPSCLDVALSPGPAVPS